MSFYFQYAKGSGFAIVMGLILLGVIIYTIIALRRQAAAAKRKGSNSALQNLNKRQAQVKKSPLKGSKGTGEKEG